MRRYRVGWVGCAHGNDQIEADGMDDAAVKWLNREPLDYNNHNMKTCGWLWVVGPKGGNSTHYNVTGPPWQVAVLR